MNTRDFIGPSLPDLGDGPKKFNFVSKTISCWEVHTAHRLDMKLRVTAMYSPMLSSALIKLPSALPFAVKMLHLCLCDVYSSGNSSRNWNHRDRSCGTTT